MPEQLKPLPTQLHPDMIGLNEPNYEIMAEAMRLAEGGDKTSHAYGVKSVKVKDEAEAKQVAINTARNNFKRWMDAGKPATYMEFMADRYAPPSVDPVGNHNWKINVPSIYAKLLQQQGRDVTRFPVDVGYVRSVLPNYKVQ